MGKRVVWVVVAVLGLIVVGSIVISLLGLLLKLAVYLLVGALVVGGGIYVVRRVRGGIGGPRRRSLR